MEPVEYMALANAAINLVEALIPKIQELTKQGLVSPEDQQKLFDRANTLMEGIESGLAFSGPEWQKSTVLPPSPPQP